MGCCRKEEIEKKAELILKTAIHLFHHQTEWTHISPVSNCQCCGATSPINKIKIDKDNIMKVCLGCLTKFKNAGERYFNK